MKKLIVIALAAAMVLALIGGTVLAKGPSGPAGKSNVGHINLVEKDENWNIIEDGAWGKLKYKLSGTTLDVVLNAGGLVPGNWYYAELADVSGPWTPINETGPGQAGDNDCYAMFYAQANGGGNIHISFSTNMGIDSGMQLEVGIKNADWAALLSPSTPGDPTQWVGPTGQGWSYVLWSDATIAIP